MARSIRTPARRNPAPGLAAAASVLALAGSLAGGCDRSGEAGELTLQGEAPLFPGFSYDTGLVPEGASVQASFSVVAHGKAGVSAKAVASEEDEPTLTGLPDTGKVTIAGHFGLEGRLVIDVSGLPSYDGPIPGIENVAVSFGTTAAFDPFSIGKQVKARADIEPARLPGIPLPVGIPGSLVIEVAEGSHLEVTLSGKQACLDDDKARYLLGIERAGLVVLRPLIEIEVPILGVQTFEIPSVEVPLALGDSELMLTAEVDATGDKPREGDHVTATCAKGGTGGGGGQSGAVACTSDADCGGLPCVEGTCSDVSGVCASGLTTNNAYLDVCFGSFCCEELEACTFGHTDMAGCNECLAKGYGPRCDALLQCAQALCTEGPPGWTCQGTFYGDGICDCGCGIVDIDCRSSSSSMCEACALPGSCVTEATCPGNLNPSLNSECL